MLVAWLNERSRPRRIVGKTFADCARHPLDISDRHVGESITVVILADTTRAAHSAVERHLLAISFGKTRSPSKNENATRQCA